MSIDISLNTKLYILSTLKWVWTLTAGTLVNSHVSFRVLDHDDDVTKRLSQKERHKENVTESRLNHHQQQRQCSPQRPNWFPTQSWCWWTAAATAQVDLVLDVVVVVIVVVVVAVETAHTFAQRDAIGLVFSLHCKVFTWKNPI